MYLIQNPEQTPIVNYFSVGPGEPGFNPWSSLSKDSKMIGLVWFYGIYNVESSIEQVLASTPHETPTIQTLAPPSRKLYKLDEPDTCWRSKDELISDVLLWTPTYGRAKAGQPARTYIQQLCEDTGCNPEDLPEAMNDREKWRERVRDIRAGGTT